MKIGLNRKTIDIEAYDKIFKIGIFPIICDVLIVKHDSLEKEYEKIENPTADDVNGKNQAQYNLQFEILENLLNANGYEFKKDWWEKHFDSLAISEFIVISKSKDAMPTPKKKEQIKSH